MKKSTKSTKPATPAAKPVAPAPKTSASGAEPVKSAKKAPATKKAVAKEPVAVKPARPSPVAAPAPKKPAPSPSAPALTIISARIDIGFGNGLYLRGEGPGLSWDRGVALDCVDDDMWTITLSGASRPVIFKFLVNDLTWSAGSDYVIEPGMTVVLEPTF